MRHQALKVRAGDRDERAELPARHTLAGRRRQGVARTLVRVTCEATRCTERFKELLS